MKKRDVFLSTFSYNPVEVIAEYGIGIEFNQFCISQWLDDDTVDQTLMKMERQAFRCGLSSEKYCGLGVKGQKDFALEKTIWSEEKPLGDVVKPQAAVAHGPFTDLCPAAFDHRFSELARERFDQAAAGTLRLGLNRMVVHTGFIPVIFDPGWHLEHSVQFWWDFINQQPEDFRLYIENVMDDEPYLLLDLVKEIDDPRVRICLDVGHVNAISQISVTDWIRQLGPWIGHFHLHNNDGKHDLHAPLLEGTLNMPQVLQQIDDFCPEDATFTVESRDCHDSIGWLLSQMD